MTKSKKQKPFDALEPLPEALQMGARVYRTLLHSIVTGKIEPGTPLRPDVIARQLEVSTTPVREAMHRLEGDGLAVKAPYQGWFVRDYSTEQIRELYEVRVTLECMAVRLACERMTDAEIMGLRELQAVGETALATGDDEAHRIYNEDLHTAILKAARNSYLFTLMGQLSRQNEMLMVKTSRIPGRTWCAFKEHGAVIDAMAKRQSKEAEQLMETHVLNTLQVLVQLESGRPETRDHEGV